jgi:hypothetical protein
MLVGRVFDVIEGSDLAKLVLDSTDGAVLVEVGSELF